jgi:hypothetical protein
VVVSDATENQAPEGRAPDGRPWSERYWEIKPLRDDVYSDWEGFTSQVQLYEAVQALMRITDLNPMIADLTLHWVHENIDQGGYTPTDDEVTNTYWSYYTLLDSRYWMKSGVDWATGEFPPEED